METTVTAKVEINFKEGKKEIEMLLKQTNEIENCEEGRVVVLNLQNEETYAGFFKGMDDEDIMLGSLRDTTVIGLKANWVNNYFEQI
ncbi:MAG: hypothetical protein WC026_13290 [Hyphomicrobium sp.]|uniref:hypothetical protein n=1 Tax=Hyphomicrobium sp. TaxID=82 RepID=UPI003566C711